MELNVLRYLSDEWVRALGAALGDNPALAAACPERALVIEQAVIDGDARTTYHVVLDRTGCSAAPGPAAAPTIRFEQDLTTASGIAQGTVSAQEAFMSGRLRLAGDATAILGSEALFAALTDSLATLRNQTDFV